jgi:hypothetical protein
MNVRSSVFSASVVALSLVGSILLSSAPAQAFGLSFSPAGGQDGTDNVIPSLDILDLEVIPGSDVVFDLLFEASNLSSGDQVTDISFLLAFDDSELLNFSAPGSTPVAPVNGALGTIQYRGLKYSGLPIAGGSSSTSLGKISFKAATLLSDDGVFDFSVLLTGVTGTQTLLNGTSRPMNFLAANGGNGPHLFKQVEVQGPTTAVPTPALLPGMVAFGLGLVRKRKQELVG